jgi:hypothetical protein
MEKAQLQYVSGWMFSAFGLASVRYVQTLLFGVKGSDPALPALPALALVVTTLLAALPAVARAAAIDPAIMLRAE